MASVTVSALKKKFGQTEVLKGVSVDVPEGAFAVLVGPSGCGKSTLLRLLAGLEEADSGTIQLGNRDVTKLEPRDRNIAMVFQSYALYPHLTVRENLAFGLKLRKTGAAEIEKRVKEASDMLGLGALLDRLPKQLSGGQRQRVAMGRAIVRQADLFLFDEPLSNLDAALRAQVRVDIRKLHDKLNATSVYVTHDQVEAMTLADVIFVLNKGQVEQSGPPLDIFNKPATKFVAGFLGSPAMNFIEGQVIREGQSITFRANDGLAVPLDPSLFVPNLESGKKVTLGVRPHEVNWAEAEKCVGHLSVSVVEALGAETYAHGELGSNAFVARLESSSFVKKGTSFPVTFRSIHLFDAATGKSLRAS